MSETGNKQEEHKHKIKSIKLELGVIIIALILAIIYFYPKVITHLELKKEAEIRRVCRTLVENVLKKTKDTKLQKKPAADLQNILQETMAELNSGNKTVCGERKCPYCCMVEFDEKTNSVIITGYDGTLEVLSRTVITPPSFVMYER